ncbi:MAG: DUF2961 domain-containing protein [Eubacteriales bacterium]|nr:DUF2961 domain-containing protein [Eubacteriales bacterium]
MGNTNLPASLSTIAVARDSKRMRESSYDRSGGNDDRVHIQPGETFTICDIKAAGCINHIWFTLANDDVTEVKYYLRKSVLRFYWDGEEEPSVLAPTGDFFGMGHGMSKNFVSEPLQMSPEDGKGFNCWFPMPFGSQARMTITNESDRELLLYYYVDYEVYQSLPEEMLRFHAKWHREMPTQGVDESEFETHREWCFGRSNLTGKDNYVVMEAEGKGHYVGCNVNIHNLNKNALWDWPGEGDDMIFIDDEPWPPRLHGTGTEDYVNMAWCPTQEYSAPYHGLILGGRDNWKGKISYYRYHITDPVMFEKSIKVTIEHGHDNHRSDDWSSTAYWYQTEPHKPFEEILPVEKRLPIDEDVYQWEGKTEI